jgi:hypothetical protein
MASYQDGRDAAGYIAQQPQPPPSTYQGGSYNNTQTDGQAEGNEAPPPYPPPDSVPKGEPPSYDELFAIKKPKWNDVWAGLLFLATCAGFVAVSGISIQGYCE